LLIHKWVIGRHFAVFMQAMHLAQVVGQRLSVFLRSPLANREEYVAVSVKYNAASEVYARITRRLCGKKLFQINQLVSVKFSPRNHSSTAVIGLLRIAEVNPSVFSIVGMKLNVHQT